MSKKKTVSFSDFTVDDSFGATNDNLTPDNDGGADASAPDADVDDDKDQGKPDPKKDKKVIKAKTAEPDNDDDDPDTDDPDDGDDKPDPKVKDKLKKPDPKQSKVVDDGDDDPDDEPDGDDAEKFFEEVEKLSGTGVEVDYGDINPLSPQGVVLRDKAIKQQALDSFLEEIENKFPQAFKALQHAYHGGDIAELFTQTTGRDYTKIELKEGDDALAKDILKEYYKSRGVKSEARINKMIEADEDSENGLVKEAQTALAELKEEQEQSTAKVLEQQKQKAAERQKKDQILVSAVDEVLETKKLGSFRIQDRQEAADFKKYILSSIRRTNDGNYELATPVMANELEKQLQYFYFQFKKGDLSKIIQQKAATENAKKLSLKLANEQSKTKRNTIIEDRTTLSLKDFSR